MQNNMENYGKLVVLERKKGVVQLLPWREFRIIRCAASATPLNFSYILYTTLWLFRHFYDVFLFHMSRILLYHMHRYIYYKSEYRGR